MTQFHPSDVAQYLQPGKRAHLVGIGGVSMCALGMVLQGMGVTVTGSDMHQSKATDNLEKHGIPVVIGHFAESIQGADCVIRTAAAHDDNPEIAAAVKAGIPVFERAQTWGYIMSSYKNAVCFSGTHGKTTSTSMMTHIAMEGGLDPTVMIGGYLNLLDAGHRVGKGDTIIMESCEYCNSFLNFTPTIAVILDIDADHLDFFKDLADIQHSFRQFAELTPPSRGIVVANGMDKNTMDALKGIDRKVITFGLTPDMDVYPVHFRRGHSSFDVICGGSFYTHVDLRVLGVHNCMDALSAIAAAWLLGISPEAVTRGLVSFTGAARRMEFKGVYRGADIYDDYAHHPGELKATLDAIPERGYSRTIVVFQPHTYSRTKALFDEFVEQLRRPDITILAEIYAAREQNTVGISSKDLADQIPCGEYYPTFEEITARLKEIAAPGDLILTIGAGNIYEVGEQLAEAAN
ncbi:MAG: UDP-N-acetylmuramate--L-alanine ligase [Oscillospiraceae bacterium]|nr:UDP-N-acetylmuramate--L-alanine ligase [Oscillospiraceae bacterium]